MKILVDFQICISVPLNVKLILRRCLCFLIGLMAQNPKINHILCSGKAYLYVVFIIVKAYT